VHYSVALLAFLLLSGRTAVLSEQSAPAHPGTHQGVDDITLATAPPEEWLSHGRDYAETHFSPLRQISTSNVSHLGLQWS
jgi:glucose dehydrogenase